jgi:hypothetical protein
VRIEFLSWVRRTLHRVRGKRALGGDLILSSWSVWALQVPGTVDSTAYVVGYEWRVGSNTGLTITRLYEDTQDAYVPKGYMEMLEGYPDYVALLQHRGHLVKIGKLPAGFAGDWWRQPDWSMPPEEVLRFRRTPTRPWRHWLLHPPRDKRGG